MASPRIIQNDRMMELAVGDVAFVDAARPVTHACERERPVLGGLCNCRADPCGLIWAWSRGAPLDAGDRLQRDRSVNSSRTPSRTSNQCPFQPKPTCVSHSTIYWVHYSRRPIRKMPLFKQTGCS